MALVLLNLFFSCTRKLMFAVVFAVIMLSILINTANANTSWQWSHSQKKERIVINLADNNKVLSLERIATQQLALSLSQIPRQFVGDNNSIYQSKMLSHVALHGKTITLSLKNPSFGYMITYPSPKQVVIDLFYDPLGERWISKGKISPKNDSKNKKLVKNDLNSNFDGQYNLLKSKDYLGILANSALEKTANSALEKTANSALEKTANSGNNSRITSDKFDFFELKGDDVSYWSKLKTILFTKAYAAQEILPDGTPKVVIINPQNIRATINKKGPDVWDNVESFSTTLDPTPASNKGEQDALEKSSDNANLILDSLFKGKGQIPSIAEDVQPKSLDLEGMPENSAGINLQVPPTLKNGAISSDEKTEQKDVVKPPVVKTEQKVIPKQVEAEPNISNIRSKVEAPKNAKLDAPVDETAVIYHNEQGEVIPKPLEPDEMIANANELIKEGSIAEAIDILKQVKTMSLQKELYEEVLYLISDNITALYAGKPLEGYDPIVTAANEAMNVNLQSSRVPDMLFRLGLINMNVGNLKEAGAYFELLKKRFPHDLNVPISFVSLGQEQLKVGKYDEAIASFKVLLDDYIESSSLKSAVVGLSNTLYAKGDIDELDIIIDFIGKRWARHYVDDQKYLLMVAENFVNKNKLKEALETYWHYYNLVPKNPENHILLARIGDLYLRTNQRDLAFEIFDSVIDDFPDTEGYAYATLRKAELGIHDSPISIAEMFDTFSEIEDKTEPNKTYNNIMKLYENEPYAILAYLKLAMLQLWNKEYTDAMGTASDFIDKYPDHENVPEARDVIVKAFKEEFKISLAEQNYGRILSLWNGFPLVRQRYGKMDDDMRYVLARGHLEKGEDAKTLEYLSEFLKTPKNPKYSDYAFTLFFNKYLQSGNWNAILDLADSVATWEIDPRVRGQLDYAEALAAENLGLTAKALPLWKYIAEKKNNVELYEKAYATYFLAKDAERRKDIADSYKFNVATLNLFKKLEEERSDKADPERVKEAVGSLMDITEVANRIPESLKWVNEYKDLIPTDSPDLMGLRFREARLYRKLGDLDKSKSILEQIVVSDPKSPFGMAAALELRTFEVSRNLRKFLPDDTQ